SFLAELSLRATSDGDGEFGIGLKSAKGEAFRFSLMPAETQARATLRGGETRTIDLPNEFDFAATHALRLEIDHRTLELSLDNVGVKLSAILPETVSHLMLFSDKVGGAFCAFTITLGFEDRFESGSLEGHGWKSLPDEGEVRIHEKSLQMASEIGERLARISKTVPPGDFELCINFRIQETTNAACAFAISCGNSFSLTKTDGWMLHVDGQSFRLPTDFNPAEY